MRLGYDGTLERYSDGTLPAFVWPGGYPIIYIADDGAVFCAGCANGENGSLASETADERSGWRIIGADVFEEGAAEQCAHCGAGIKSAFGDPESEEG